MVGVGDTKGVGGIDGEAEGVGIPGVVVGTGVSEGVAVGFGEGVTFGVGVVDTRGVGET
jgi:hypothetical protein